jgi:hypothetical protein
MGWIQGEVGYYTLCNGSNGAYAPTYPCSNSAAHLAWPRLTTTGCYRDCGPNADQICNSPVYVYNQCNTDQGWAYVRDCGTMDEGCCCEGAWCGGSPYGGAWAVPLADLSEGLFLFMGGDEAKGRFPVWICQVPYDC